MVEKLYIVHPIMWVTSDPKRQTSLCSSQPSLSHRSEMLPTTSTLSSAACSTFDAVGSTLPYLFKPWEWKQEAWTHEDIPDLKGKVALVTGGTGGIGLETCYALVRHGAHVFLGARSELKFKAALEQIRTRLSLEPLPNQMEGEDEIVLGKIEYLECDLTTMNQADRAAKAFLQAGTQRLDIFIACAGKGTGKSELTEDQIESFMATNTVNHMVMLRRLLPLLRKTSHENRSSSSRIIFVASCAHRWCSLPWPLGSPTSFDSWKEVNDEKRSSNNLYSQSKLAQILLSSRLNRELQALDSDRQGGCNIACISLHPGEINNNFVQRNFLREVSRFHILKLAQNYPAILQVVLLNAIEGARTCLFAATSTQIDKNKWSGKYLTYPCQLGRPSEAAKDEKMEDRCWHLVQSKIDEKFGPMHW